LIISSVIKTNLRLI